MIVFKNLYLRRWKAFCKSPSPSAILSLRLALHPPPEKRKKNSLYCRWCFHHHLQLSNPNATAMNGSPVNCLHSQGNHHEGILHCFVIQMHSQLIKRLLHLEEKKLPWIPNKPWGAAIFGCCSHVQYFFWFQSVPQKNHPTCVRISVVVQWWVTFLMAKTIRQTHQLREVGSLSPSIYRVLYIPSGCFFRPSCYS